MKTSGPWSSADIQAQIKPPPNPLIKVEPEEQKMPNIIMVDNLRNISQAALETYKAIMYNFNDGQLEYFFMILRNHKSPPTEPAQPHLHSRIFIYVPCYMKQVLEKLMNFHYRETRPTTI